MVALAVTGSARPAQAQKAPRVGIVVSTHVNLSAEQAEAVAGALAHSLRDQLVVDVIGGVEATRRLPPGGVPESCMVDAACVTDLAGRLSVEQLLFLVVVKIGERVQVDISWVEPGTMQSASRARVELDQLGSAADRFAEVARQLLPEAQVRTTAAADNGLGAIAAEPVATTRTIDRHMTTPAWIAAGVGVTSLGFAVGFTLAARSDYNSLDSGCGQSASCSDDQLDSLDRKALAADLLWGAAAASAVTAGVLWWLSGGEVVTTTGPTVGPGPAGSVGLTLGGAL